MIFISSPYSHPSDAGITQQRYIQTCEYAAHLFAQSQMAISPVIVGHNLLGYEKLPSDFNFWKDYSFELLKQCEEMHVLMLPGWETSQGVNAELDFAKEHNISLHFVEVSPSLIDKTTYIYK